MLKGKIDFIDLLAKMEDNSNKDYASIGEYQEKSIHNCLKNYYEVDKNQQEVKIGNFIADICNESGIIEIQSRNFDKLRDKLAYFLDENYEVTIVYPIIVNKMIIYKQDEEGHDEIRRSPSHKNAFSGLAELYKIKNYLKNKHLHFQFVYLDAIDFKEKLKVKKYYGSKSKSIDKIPLNLQKEEYFDSYFDFKNILEGIDTKFSAKELAKMTKSQLKDVRISLTLLKFLGLIQHIENKGREFVYEVIK